MKKLLLFLFILGTSYIGHAQARPDTSLPVYLQYPHIPIFSIMKATDSTAFTREDLQKKRPVVFIIFSPECEHCQHETKELTKNITRFKDAQIIMITYLPHPAMVAFYHDYHIAEYPSITMGRDPKFFFPVYFQVKTLPAIYVYDRKGNFKKSFEGSVPVDKIAAEL